MKKQLICSVLLFIATVAYAQEHWGEDTRDAAYEAPNSLLQKKWKSNDGTWSFSANGILKITDEISIEGVRVSYVVSAKYTRKKDKINVTYTGVKATPNQSDLAGVSARKRDPILKGVRRLNNEFTSMKNKTEHYIMLRLDDECLIITNYNPQTNFFNDLNWTVFYNELHWKKEEERAAQRAIIRARQDSIKMVGEKRRESEDRDKIFDACEQPPTFKDGDVRAWLAKNMQYPPEAAENGISGRVVIGYVVERDGSISNVQVLRGVDPSLDKEAVRLVKSMPKWNPGMTNGSPVRVKYNVPVQFKLQ